MGGMQAQLWHVAATRREEEIARAEARRVARRLLAEQRTERRAQRAAGRQPRPRFTGWWKIAARTLGRPARRRARAGAVGALRTDA